MKQYYNVSCIILAAGAARRMGKLKQTLLLGDRTILEHVIYLALEENFSEVITVIGHKASKIQTNIKINDPRFRWVVNHSYQTGQSSSLMLGVNSIQNSQKNLMVFLGDLPFIKAKTIRTIYETGLRIVYGTKTSYIIRPIYRGVSGHPVFFGNIEQNFFNKLEGDHGARMILDSIDNHINIVVNDRGIITDIDTPKDYEIAVQSKKDKK